MVTRQLPAIVLASLTLPAPSLSSVTPVEILDLVAQHQGKVVLLNFWATWCAPCLQEFPDIVEMEKRYRDRGLVVISVSADYPDRIDSELLPFLEKHQPGFEVHLIKDADNDELTQAIDPDWTGKIPATFFFDRQGRSSVKRYTRMSREEMVRILEYLFDKPDR